MPDVYGTNAAIAFNTTPAGKVNGALWGGKVRVIYDSYTAAALASGNEIIIGRVNQGDVILPITTIQNDDLGAGTDATLTFVIEAISDAAETSIIASIDADAAALTTLGTAIGNINAFPVVVAKDSWVKLKYAGTNTATGNIKSYVFVATAE